MFNETIARTFLFLLDKLIKPLISLVDLLYVWGGIEEEGLDTLLVEQELEAAAPLSFEETQPLTLQNVMPDDMRDMIGSWKVSFLDRSFCGIDCLINAPDTTGFVAYPNIDFIDQQKFFLLMCVLRARFGVSLIRLEEPSFTIICKLNEEGVWQSFSSRAIADA